MAGNVYGLRLLADVRVQRLGLAIVLGFALVYRLVQLPFGRPDLQGYDFENYWIAARHLLAGEPIYSAAQLGGSFAAQGQAGFVYPPALLLLVLPLALLSPSSHLPAAATWALAGALVLIGSILALARAEGLSLRFPLLRGRWVWLLVAAAFALQPVVDELVNGNVNMLLVGLLTVAWLGLRRGDPAGDGLAGVALGAATLVKLFPGLFLLWLLLRGRWRPVAWALAGAAALAVISLPITGLEPWLQYPTVLLNMAGPTDTAAALSPATWLAPLIGFDVAKLLVWLAVGLATIWFARRAGERVGFASTAILALLATPALWTHYLSVVVVPMLLGLGAGASPALLGLAYLCMSAGYQAALGDAVWITVRLLPTLGLLLVLLALIRRVGRDQARTASERPAPSAAESPA